jgi:peroxiredoxin
MNKNINKLITVILILTSTFKSFSQDITEENYLKLDKEIWDFQDQEFLKISKAFELNPEKKDSLIIASDEIVKISENKNIKLAIKFASVPSGLQRVYMLRLNIPKDTLKYIYKRLPENMQKSAYGKSIRLHIDSKQIEKGDNIVDFHAIDYNGNPFKISSLKEKNTLLLYGGLKCLREDGRKLLKKYYNSLNGEKFKIVLFDEESSNAEDLRIKREKYGLDIILVSDFIGEHSPMKIIYGAQTTPTYFFINEKGKVILKTDDFFTAEKELESMRLKIN